MFIQINENPKNKLVGDCVIRAISTFLNQDWNTTYLGLAVQGYIDADLMSADEVWGNYLIHKGYERSILPHDCPSCLTVRDFAELHPNGKFLLFVGGHVVPVINGNYYDTYDSGDRVVIYFFQKVRRNKNAL